MNVGGSLAAAATAVLYGTAYVATAIAFDGFTPIGVAVLRGAAGAVLVALLLATPPMWPHRLATPPRGAAVRLLVLGTVGGGLFLLALNAAVALAGATVAAFVAGLYAVVAALLAVPVLGERLEARMMVALAAALAGTALLGDVGGATDLVGIVAGLGAAAAFGTYLVLARRWSGPYRLSGAVTGLVTLLMSAVVAAIAALATGDPIVSGAPPAHALVAIVWLAAGPSAVASVLVVIGMRRLPARVASLLLLLNPPTAAVLAFVLLGERLETAQLVGAVLVLGSIAAASGAFASGRHAAPGPA